MAKEKSFDFCCHRLTSWIIFPLCASLPKKMRSFHRNEIVPFLQIFHSDCYFAFKSFFSWHSKWMGKNFTYLLLCRDFVDFMDMFSINFPILLKSIFEWFIATASNSNSKPDTQYRKRWIFKYEKKCYFVANVACFQEFVTFLLLSFFCHFCLHSDNFLLFSNLNFKVKKQIKLKKKTLKSMSFVHRIHSTSFFRSVTRICVFCTRNSYFI